MNEELVSSLKVEICNILLYLLEKRKDFLLTNFIRWYEKVADD